MPSPGNIECYNHSTLTCITLWLFVGVNDRPNFSSFPSELEVHYMYYILQYFLNDFKECIIYKSDLSDVFHVKADGTSAGLGEGAKEKTVLGAFYFWFPGEVDLKETSTLLNWHGKHIQI